MDIVHLTCVTRESEYEGYLSGNSSLTTPREFLERAISPPPGHKESAKPRPLGQKNRAKTPRPGQLFPKIQQK